jgi:hypothetical protein
MLILLPLLICILGALVYALSVNPKLQELGRLSYWVGLLVFLARFGETTVNLFK